MVLREGEPSPGERAVIRVLPDGRRQWYDPDTGRIISRADAVRRVRFDFETGWVRDSFGRNVGVGNLRIPQGGIARVYKTVDVRYGRLVADPSRLTPGNNQEIVERVTMINRDGTLRTVETSWGLGKRYDPSQYTKRWASEAADAAGVRIGDRGAYEKMKGAVLQKEYIVKTIVPRG